LTAGLAAENPAIYRIVFTVSAANSRFVEEKLRVARLAHDGEITHSFSNWTRQPHPSIGYPILKLKSRWKAPRPP